MRGMTRLAIMGVPGAQGGAFSPANIDALTLWLDASNPETLWKDAARTQPAIMDDDPVYVWDNLAGGNNAAGQATKPTLKLNASPLLKPSVYFSPNSFMKCVLVWPPKYTIFIVYAGYVSGSFYGSSQSSDSPIQKNTAVYPVAYYPPIPLCDTLSNNTIFSLEANATDDIYVVRLNGVLVGSDDHAANPPVGDMWLGMGFGNYLTGYVHEVIMVNRILSASEQNQLGEYLGAKW